MAERKKTTARRSTMEDLDQARVIADDDHPDFLAGTLSEDSILEAYDEDHADADADAGDDKAFLHAPGIPRPTLPRRIPFPGIPRPIPPGRIPFPSFCSPISGKYTYTPLLVTPRPLVQEVHTPWPIRRPTIPRPIPGPIVPINFLRITVRVDVDRFLPQNRISIEVSQTFPRRTAHVIAEVTSDSCSGHNRRTVQANIIYREGTASLIPGSTVTFKARRTTGLGYGAYSLRLSGGGITPRTYNLSFRSRYFDPVEFEVDRVANSGGIVTSYNTATHPNKQASLPNETLSLATVFQRAGFDVSMSPNTSVIPTSGAGANGTWSDSEMHNAMVTYWSRFANRPNWAMWILYAARHDSGRGLGGIMFDDIGPNHRQGTAIFTDSFIQDVPGGDPNPAAWRNRMQFWTAVHEMGHSFNLAHSWQKALGAPQAPGDPWIPLANEPEARSFMNYPFNVSGGESSFFSNFRFRFSDDELIFMRHAPRRFVQMGNSNWFVNHGFEQPDEMNHTGNWGLEIRPNRKANSYRFLEPVNMELKLTNTSAQEVEIDGDMLTDGRHATVFIQREGGQTKQWRPMVTRTEDTQKERLEVSESIYGAHVISTSTDGWLIDEPGFYKVQAAIDMVDEIIVSNVLRIYVAPPASGEEAAIAPDYFTEDVGRYLAFGGAPALDGAKDVLEQMVKTCAGNPAASHAEVALTTPMLRNFKVFDVDGGRENMAIKTVNAKVGTAAKVQANTLLKKPAVVADTIGHIAYFAQLRMIAEAMEDDGDEKGAVKLMAETIAIMKERSILPSVIENAERRLKRRR